MVIGLTGNIGSGKSTVAEVFANLGATVIDGDVLGREVTEEEPEYRDWLRQRFGEEIWQGETLDRAALGRIVFADGGKRDELNTAIWPYIRKRLADRIRTVLEQDGIPVVDAAMIFEWGDQDRYDALVAVVVDLKSAQNVLQRGSASHSTRQWRATRCRSRWEPRRKSQLRDNQRWSHRAASRRSYFTLEKTASKDVTCTYEPTNLGGPHAEKASTDSSPRPSDFRLLERDAEPRR